MKILHYALGFPPYRTGGLTKYCTDLMLTQREQGHQVALMWPGQIGFVNKTLKIRKGKSWNDILSFEVINPLPVALDEGIVDIEAYTKSVNAKPYFEFLKRFVPDVIHIHTLMGLHREFLDVAKDLGIRTVFTSHDYYGLCPKVTLFCNGKPCDDDHDCEDCVACNCSALSMKKIILMQSPIYRVLKNTIIVKKLRQRHRQEFFEQKTPVESISVGGGTTNAQDYKKLRSYYVGMLQKIGEIHFNSTVAEKVYLRYFEPKSSQVISITHRDIKDHRKIKDFNHEKLRLTYLGPAKPFKGFQFLLQTLDELWEQGVQNFELHIYTATGEQRPYITHRQDGYSYRQQEEIFDNTDLLLAPSLWYETFGFTVLEALSYGVPVLVSENVGAKDIVGNCGVIIKVADKEELTQAIIDFTPEVTRKYKNNIQKNMVLKTWKEFVDENYVLYQSGKGEIYDFNYKKRFI